MNRFVSLLKRKNVLFTSGLVLGALLILGVRFITYSPPAHEHYHANFAVFINGQRETFSEPKYFEEVALCSLGNGSGAVVPQQRVHMHNKDGGSIHVHEGAATWGHFLNNLGWNIGKDYVVTDDGTIYRNDGASKLSIYINGQDYTGLTSITNTVIKDKDRLLISFGSEADSTIQNQVKAVPSSAADYNSKPDPSTCAGSKDSATISDRFKNLF